MSETANATKIYARAVQIPLYHLQRYYDKFRNAIFTRPVEELVDGEILETIQAAVAQENQGFERAPLEIERQQREKIDHHYYQVLTKTQAAATARWDLENAIKRGYFHVTDLDNAELENWRKYLDFEEKEGDFQRTSFLYERCLVPCALYEEFWLRYARWLFSQGKEEDCRLVYMRASCIFVPISQSTIRLNWARFEEKLGRIAIARDIHIAILEQVPDNVEAITSLAGVDRRHDGNDAAVATLESYINVRNAQVGGVLATEQARILWRCKGASDEARQLFKDKIDRFAESKMFWLKYLEFEVAQAASDDEEGYARVKAVHDLLRSKGRLPADASKELSHFYMEYLLDYAGKDAANEFMQLDKEINGYVSSKNVPLPPAGSSKPHSSAKKRKHNKNKAAAAANSQAAL
jgi:pre-mRNA-processing factor 39